ncbi:hypothetical protein ACWT_4747 [Actinoplanes sp. SE50]|uniref:hypothetical protein n=1 Tax=unclassified Actinoplanes TaxID=2626549 RepID=UPI00023EBF6C|nr:MULTISPECIES: hypothetical protein [unclassified Actinoplanes]AEV85769.1 hypothetical protein ACPL_4878 [Actinoplanes sp. SE50/110]ATO84162.1 hypothetical protein ACWT_4747 [Actinoplanes sp. SE50]SLM01572.1 secreted protein of unknown function [Actinoplanes sp. SE50/110]
MRPKLLAALAALTVTLPIGSSAQAAPDPAPNGRISLADLREATLDVPAWPADNVRGPSGRLHFHRGQVPVEGGSVAEGQPPYGDSILILSVAYGDVDHDGADETIVTFGCLIEGGSKQVVVYDRDATGAIISLGRVAATTGPVRDIRADSPKVTGGVLTTAVADYQRCCDDRTPQIWQTRGYALRSGKFVQVSGPRRMPVNPHVTDASITAGPLTLGPEKDGFRYGTTIVTVTRHRGARPEQFTLSFFPPEGLERSGAGWPKVTEEPDWFRVTVPAPPSDDTVSYPFTFRRPAAATGGELDIELGTVPEMGLAVPWTADAAAPIRP